MSTVKYSSYAEYVQYKNCCKPLELQGIQGSIGIMPNPKETSVSSPISFVLGASCEVIGSCCSGSGVQGLAVKDPSGAQIPLIDGSGGSGLLLWDAIAERYVYYNYTP